MQSPSESVDVFAEAAVADREEDEEEEEEEEEGRKQVANLSPRTP